MISGTSHQAEATGFGDGDLLDRLLARDGIEAPATAAAEPAASRAPLSYAQQRVWFFEQWQPGTATYHVPAAFWLRGELDADGLRAALLDAIRRHGALRTVIDPSGDEPAQVMLPEARLPFVEHDVRDTADPRAAALALAHETLNRPFSLVDGPPLRACLVRTADDLNLLAIAVHHIVFDGWSLENLLHELSGPGRPGAVTQYTEFAAAERAPEAHRLDGAAARLAGAPAVTTLPPDRDRPAAQTFAGETVVVDLPAPLLDTVGALARAHSTTRYATLLAVFGFLLSKHSGQSDIVLGTPVATRDDERFAGAAGLFVNTLPIRLDLSADEPFTALLGRTRAALLDAMEFHDVPFDRLADRLTPERVLTHSPVLQVVFGVHEPPEAALRLAGCTAEWAPIERHSAKFDLTVSVFTGDRPRVELEYNTDLYDRVTITALAARFERLLAAVTADPGRRAGALEMLGPDDVRALLDRAGTPGAPDRTDPRGIDEIVAQRAAATPDAVAVSAAGIRLTYRDLDERANRLAHHLRDAGAAAERTVAVCLDRDPEMVAVLLAVLRSGAAYLPVDPRYPAERVRFLLDDAGAVLVVTTSALRDRLPDTGAPVLILDEAATEIAGRPATPPPVTGGPDRLAYIIYTSGSTGQPKGVGVSHRNVVRLLGATQGWFGFGPGDVWTMFHSYAFDFSVWEIWGALSTGGRLAVVPYLVSRSPEDFRRLLADEGVTVLNQTPSAFRNLVAADDAGAAPLALRLVIFGGEAVDLGSVGQWFARHGDEEPRLVNMFGITETTVHVTYQPLSTADCEGGGNPIGVPIPDLRLYLLDAAGRLVPRGAPGEICVGGAGVSRGYLGRPALTAERFVPDPFGDVPGARLYRSGDLGRYTTGGRLEYLGRNDDQVKVRGFRIELGEVEAALAGCPGVRAAAAAVHDGRLVGYLVTDGAGVPADLAETLAAAVPAHLVPAAYVTVDRLPLTANGKLDRAELPAPGPERPDLAESYVAPRDETERVLAGCWAEVLGLDRVGVHDSFFALGGDSIRSLQALGLARARGLELTLQELFRTPTVARLATLARHATAAGKTRGDPFSLISAACREKLPDCVVDAYPMSALQAGMVFHMRLDPNTMPYHNLDSFRVRAPYDGALFARAVADTVARHPILRTTFDLAGFAEPMQLVHERAELPIEEHDLRGLSTTGQERAIVELMHEQRRMPFDLGQAPLLRYFLHRLTDDEFQWTVTEHHAIFDGWSLFSTQAEVLERYVALLADPDSPADPPPASTFRDFIELEREATGSAESRRFWRETLDGYEPIALPRLPDETVGVDNPAHREWRFTSTRDDTHRSLETLVPLDVCDRLVELGARAGVPFKSVLLAAHLKVIGLFTGRRDVVTGITANGRLEDPDATEVRGMFLNVPPIRVDLAGGSWAELIRRVFEAEEQLLPHRRYPLAQLQWDRDGEQLFDNTFLYNHFHVLQDVIGQGVEIRDDKIESFTSYRAEPTSFSLSTGFLRNPNSAQLLLNLDFYPAKVSPAQVEAIREQYLAVLAEMGARPDQPHETYEPLTGPARERILTDWNGPVRERPYACVHELIEAQTRRTPGAVAVDAPGRTVSYADLNAAANRLARRLRDLGAGPETVVGIRLPRSPELIVAMLAVLKAGAGYLPLDPALPDERTRFMLDDAGASLVVATGPVPGAGRPVVDPADAGGADPGDLGPTAVPANLAYVMYTSGSTGTPKGVLVPHAGVVNYLCWAAEGYAGRGRGGAPLFSSVAFDMVVPDIYTPLLRGERVSLLPDDLDLTELGRELSARAPFDFIKLTPGHAELLAGQLTAEQARGLAGTLVVGADAFGASTLAAWRRLDPDTVVLNEYGPTEASVGNTVFRTGGPVDGDLVPIGRAIPNTTMYVLDEALNPAPAGVPGELYIGGACVVRGYAGRAALTAERFVPDPYAAEPGARMYRTGDVGRWLPDGQLDFVGRVDDQVKVNGYRVEPGEVEVVLAGHPAVRQAVAVVHGAGRTSRRLVAHYLASDDVSPAELRDYLAERLPVWLLPAAIVPIDEVPLNSNGKVDRAALPDPGADSTVTVHIAPRTTLDAILTAACAELVGTPEVGLGDSFFALGGNSLRATQLAFRLQEALGLDVTVREVLAADRLGDLADRLAEQVRAVHDDDVVRMLSAPAGPKEEAQA